PIGVFFAREAELAAHGALGVERDEHRLTAAVVVRPKQVAVAARGGEAAGLAKDVGQRADPRRGRRGGRRGSRRREGRPGQDGRKEAQAGAKAGEGLMVHLRVAYGNGVGATQGGATRSWRMVAGGTGRFGIVAREPD